MTYRQCMEEGRPRSRVGKSKTRAIEVKVVAVFGGVLQYKIFTPEATNCGHACLGCRSPLQPSAPSKP